MCQGNEISMVLMGIGLVWPATNSLRFGKVFLYLKLLKSIDWDTVFNWSCTTEHPPIVLMLTVE